MMKTSERTLQKENSDNEMESANYDVEEEVFRQVFIPRTLGQVENFEEDIDAVHITGKDHHVSGSDNCM